WLILSTPRRPTPRCCARCSSSMQTVRAEDPRLVRGRLWRRPRQQCLVALLVAALGCFVTPRAALALGLTFHVDATVGDDARTPLEAQNPATPWKTIGKSLLHAEGGDTVLVAPGTYRERVESRRDGWSLSQPILLRSA